jgi:hypothetical protein
LLHKRAGTRIAGVALLAIAVLTLTPDLTAGIQEPSLCLICGPRGGEDAFLNLLLFIPFGFGLRLRGISRWRAWVFTIATTVTVETLQIYIPGRDSTLGDVVMNSIGGLAGIILCDSARIWLFPSVRQAKWLLVSGSMAWLALVALGGWSMKPWLPAGPYFAQLAPDLEHIEVFEGRMIDARLGGDLLVPNVRLGDSVAIRDSILRGTLRLQARVLPAGPTYGLAPIVSIAGAREAEVVVLGQENRDAVLRVRLRSGELRMNIAEVAVRAFPLAALSPHTGIAADTIELRGEVSQGRLLRVGSASRGTRTSAELALNPFLLWSLVTPGHHRSPGSFELESMAWVAMLLAPLGYWAGRWRLQERILADGGFARIMPELILMCSSAVGLAVIPPTLGFPIAKTPLWIAAIVAAGGALYFGSHWKARTGHDRSV